MSVCVSGSQKLSLCLSYFTMSSILRPTQRICISRTSVFLLAVGNKIFWFPLQGYSQSHCSSRFLFLPFSISLLHPDLINDYHSFYKRITLSLLLFQIFTVYLAAFFLRPSQKLRTCISRTSSVGISCRKQDSLFLLSRFSFFFFLLLLK